MIFFRQVVQENRTMSKRIKPVEELLESPYLTQAEIKRLFGFSYEEAHIIFKKSQCIDMRELPVYRRVYGTVPKKVRSKSVWSVIGYSKEEIDQMKRADGGLLRNESKESIEETQ